MTVLTLVLVTFLCSICSSGSAAALQPSVAEIGWTHNLIVLDHCKDDLQREFYIRMARKFGWSKGNVEARMANVE
jgi:predicted nuclease of restriction endonuclease-like (RecB) superfamily